MALAHGVTVSVRSVINVPERILGPVDAVGLYVRRVTCVLSSGEWAASGSGEQHPPGPKGVRPGTVCLSCLWSKVHSGQRGGDVMGPWVCIEKSLFALSSFQVCPLSQVKYLLSIAEYKNRV